MPSEMVDLCAEDRVDQVTERHLPLHDPHQRQGREKRQHPLREIENAAGLVDQYEAERDERIKHPRHQAVQKDLHSPNQLIRHVVILLECRCRREARRNQSWATPR